MLKIMDIDDDRSDIVTKLQKIEIQLNYLCEARNHLFEKDKRMNPLQRPQPKDLEKFETEIDNQR